MVGRSALARVEGDADDGRRSEQRRARDTGQRRAVRRVRKQFDEVMWRFGTDGSWRNMPDRYGAWQTVHHRFRQWALAGTFQTLMAAKVMDPRRLSTLGRAASTELEIRNPAEG
ncbi:transposase [Streptomyces sp. NPDC048254]|uniref:transposase n=1 Tax=Streptomyces sp. NPDC048254 TaxID=3365525 RepID=UPI00371FB69C